MIIIDTNVLVASVVEEEEDHARALALLQDAQSSGEEQCLSYATLVELSQVFYREKGSEFASQYVKSAVEFFRILKPENLATIVDLYRATHKILSFVDCEIIALAKEHGANVLTFDEEIKKKLRAR